MARKFARAPLRAAVYSGDHLVVAMHGSRNNPGPRLGLRRWPLSDRSENSSHGRDPIVLLVA
jgi:hypothetical protein